MAKLMVSLCRLASLDDCKKERENNYVIKRDFKYAIIDGSSSIFSFYSSCFETMSLLEIIRIYFGLEVGIFLPCLIKRDVHEDSI